MRLLTHNFLHSTSRSLPPDTAGYPLALQSPTYSVEPTETNIEMLLNTWNRIDWGCLSGAAAAIAKGEAATDEDVLPEALPAEKPTSAELESEEELAETLWTWLMCVHITTGQLTCPGTGRVFAIKDAIPNMILHEDEV